MISLCEGSSTWRSPNLLCKSLFTSSYETALAIKSSVSSLWSPIRLSFKFVILVSSSVKNLSWLSMSRDHPRNLTGSPSNLGIEDFGVPHTIPHPIIPHPILPHPWFYPTLFYPTLILPHPWLYPTLILPHQWLYPTLILPHLMTLPHQWLYPTHDFTPPTKGLGAADKWMMVTILGRWLQGHHPRMVTIIHLSPGSA